MKVLVCGGRDFRDRDQVYEYLDYLLSIAIDAGEEIHIIEGGARGADTFAKDWAVDRKQEFTEIKAEWDLYGKRAGYLRNIKMSEEHPDIVVAFPGGKGTQSMVEIAQRKQIPVIQIERNSDESRLI